VPGITAVAAARPDGQQTGSPHPCDRDHDPVFRGCRTSQIRVAGRRGQPLVCSGIAPRKIPPP